MNKKKIAILTMIPLFAFVLSGCGKETAEKNDDATKNAITKQAPVAQKQDVAKNTAPTSLEPLPADNKQAIESEIQGIDKDLQVVDNSLSTDTTDASLGL